MSVFSITLKVMIRVIIDYDLGPPQLFFFISMHIDAHRFIAKRRCGIKGAGLDTANQESLLAVKKSYFCEKLINTCAMAYKRPLCSR